MSYSIIGTGSALPEMVISNDELSNIVETNDEWIKTRTGIERRRICSTESINDLACDAAKKALENAGVDGEDIDLIICTTLSADFLTPSLACIVQSCVGANCIAFDINAACTGFIYALDVAKMYFDGGRANNVLIVSAEGMSKVVDWADRATCVLFGDGAGAVVLSKGEGLLGITLHAKGNSEFLTIPNIQGNSPFNKIEKVKSCLNMDGQNVYKFAVSSMCNDIADVVETANLELKDVNHILPHQANTRILDAAAKKLKFDREIMHTNISECGNTSSASIPLLIDRANREGKFKKGDIFVLAAFGGGLTSGAAIMRWTK